MPDKNDFQADILESIRKDEFYCESFDLFRELHPALESKLREAASRGNHKVVGNCSHILKSRLRMLGCITLGDDVEKIEKEADALSSADLIESVESTLDCITGAIDQISSILADAAERE